MVSAPFASVPIIWGANKREHFPNGFRVYYANEPHCAYFVAVRRACACFLWLVYCVPCLAGRRMYVWHLLDTPDCNARSRIFLRAQHDDKFTESTRPTTTTPRETHARTRVHRHHCAAQLRGALHFSARIESENTRANAAVSHTRAFSSLCCWWHKMYDLLRLIVCFALDARARVARQRPSHLIFRHHYRVRARDIRVRARCEGPPTTAHKYQTKVIERVVVRVLG